MQNDSRLILSSKNAKYSDIYELEALHTDSVSGPYAAQGTQRKKNSAFGVKEMVPFAKVFDEDGLLLKDTVQSIVLQVIERAGKTGKKRK